MRDNSYLQDDLFAVELGYAKHQNTFPSPGRNIT